MGENAISTIHKDKYWKSKQAQRLILKVYEDRKSKEYPELHMF